MQIWQRPSRCILTNFYIIYRQYTTIYQYSDTIQSGPKKCIHSLLMNIFGINLNEISISGWECNIIYNSRISLISIYNSRRSIITIYNSRTSLISILLLYKYSSYDYSNIFLVKMCVHFFWATLYIKLGHITAACFYRKRSYSGQWRTLLRYNKIQ